MDLRSAPVWAAWASAVFGGGLMLAVLRWMRAPAMRTRRGAVSLAVMLVVVLVITGGADRLTLWFAGGFFAIAALAVLPVGRLPLDMPVRGEPEYQSIARRGRLAGVLLVTGEAAWVGFLAVYR
jgi:hypothetical protein